MKRLLIPLLLLMSLTAANAFAVCSAPVWSGPMGTGQGAWYDYTQPRSSYTLSNTNLGTITGCSIDGFDYPYGYVDTATTCFHLDSNTPFWHTNTWRADLYVQLSSPDHTFYDSVKLYAIVTHPDGSQNTYTLYSTNGALGDINDCQPHGGTTTFTASSGDDVQIKVRVSNLGTGSIIKTGVPRIFNTY